MIDIDLLIVERLREQQRQRELEDEGRRLWLPLPEPVLKQPKEEQREPKRVIEIQL